MEEELIECLGHEKHQAPTVENGSIGNGTWLKVVLAEAAGEVMIAVPRDRDHHVRTGDRPRSDNVASGTWMSS